MDFKVYDMPTFHSHTVTLKIIRDRKVLAQQTSSGAYVIATVDGTY